MRARLDGKRGKRFWQSLDDLADAPGFEEMLREEFPRQASELTDGVSRRGFMKVMGASLALAGMTGCTKQPDEPIYPYIKQPEDLVLGRPELLCDRVPVPHRRSSGAGQERGVPPDQGRRQPGAPCFEGPLGPVYAGDAARPVRP